MISEGTGESGKVRRNIAREALEGGEPHVKVDCLIRVTGAFGMIDAVVCILRAGGLTHVLARPRPELDLRESASAVAYFKATGERAEPRGYPGADRIH